MPPDELVVSLSRCSEASEAHIVITQLPRGRALVKNDGGLAMREGATYRYRVECAAGYVNLEPAELIEPDDNTGRTGRIRPGQAVGRLLIALTVSGVVLHGEVVVLPATFGQSEQFRQMLEDIAEQAAEAVLQGFAPATLDLAPSNAPAELLYQRFAVLQSCLESDDFAAAIGRVIHQPHRGWQTETEHRPTGHGFPRGSAFGRAVAAPGPRCSWSAGQAAGLTSLPRQLPIERQDESLDTVPNRFVKHALHHWRGLADQLLSVLSSPVDADSGPIRRGRDAAREVIGLLDELLGHPLFGQVGRLDALPTSNQVLLRRYGYREIFRTFALVETGVALSFEKAGLDDLFSASQRNIATLYEFWCFLVLADAVGQVCGISKTAHAFDSSGDGLSLTLRSGRASVIQWDVERRGRQLTVELYFNRSFSVVRGAYLSDGSWTRAMRPDCSVRIRPLTAVPGNNDLDVWIHFDAKYRVDRLVEQLAPTPEADDEQAAADDERTESVARSKREDLLKMHAYRDAIHRTVGAYILYPGDTPLQISRFTEVVPGLGAFPLQPGPIGAEGAEDLRLFVEDVVQHVSDQASDDERDRFWTASIHRRLPAPAGLSPAPFLNRPPADTVVLLGYVRGPEHREWIEQTGKYNVRADDDRAGGVRMDGRELSASLVLLYEYIGGNFRFLRLARAGSWRAVDRGDLLRSGYPNPHGRLYFVTDVTPLQDVPGWMSDLDIRPLVSGGHPRGVPVAVTWWDILRQARRRPGLDPSVS